MPTYSLRQHDNGIFYIHWTEDRRSKRESTGQAQETAAQIYLGEWLKGEAQDKAGAAIVYTVDDLWTLYVEKHIEKNAVDQTTSVSVWKNLGPHFGALALPGVNEAKVDEYIELREEGEIGKCPAAPATIRSELARLKACFHWCADPKRKIIGVADVPLFDLPPDSPPRDNWLRADQVKALMAAAAELRVDGLLSRAERFLWLALETAARKTAILELTWNRVDFKLNTVNYNVPGRRKTKKRRVVVPISTALRPVLLRAYDERDGDLVCGSAVGGIYQAVRAVAKAAAIETKVGPHVLRHTAATHMLRNGVPIWQVAGILGDTVATVERVYGHHIPDGMAGAVEMIYGGLPAPAPTMETT